MGSPVTKKKNVPVSLSSPTFVEKINVIDLGRRVAAPQISRTGIALILDGIRDALLPMVRYLDKPLKDLIGFGGSKLPDRYRTHRAMLIYGPETRPVFRNLALDRRGMWIVCVKDEESADIVLINSSKLADILAEAFDAEVPFGGPALSEWKQLEKRIPLMKPLVRHSRIIRFVVGCRETVECAVRSQEERTRTMRLRLALVGDLGAGLDPFVSERVESRWPAFSIFAKDSHGTRRQTHDYLSRSALAPLEAVAKRYSAMPAYGTYEVFDGSHHPQDVRSPIRFFADTLESIHRGRLRGKEPGNPKAEEIFGCMDWRLPLTEDEIDAVNTFLMSIFE